MPVPLVTDVTEVDVTVPDEAAGTKAFDGSASAPRIVFFIVDVSASATAWFT